MFIFIYAFPPVKRTSDKLKHCRYDANRQELISEEIGVAYPIIAGIPRLVPTAGRVIEATAAANANKPA